MIFWFKNLRFAFDVNLSHEDIKISYLTRINKIIINMFPKAMPFLFVYLELSYLKAFLR